jgi:UDP-N-acetylglucosamine--N-acetylmuramyl-(pentapeptide) pyrophosphoryl-undecaprenol N-acetylglucosamine transferase
MAIMLQLGKKRLFPLTEPKVYLSISSEGFGHSSRALAIAREFPKSEVLIGSYSYALERIKRAGVDCVPITQEYKLMGSQGSFDVGQTIMRNQSSLLAINQVVAEERDLMRAHGVTLVVADGRIAPVIAASRLGIPCLVLTNQSDFYPFFQHDSAFVKLFGKSFEWWMRTWLSSADEILIPDFYPPDTICLMNLSPSFHVKKRTRFLGPLVSWRRDEVVPLPRPEGYDAYVVVSLGGHAYRQPLLEAVLQVAPLFPHVYFDLLTSLPVFQAPSNVFWRGQVQESAPMFKAADFVITQAGHSTAMELLTLGTPAIIVPDMLQSEQANNALRMESMGVATRIEYEDLKPDPSVLAKSIDTMLRTSRYKRNAEQMALKSANINGTQQAAKVLGEYSHRLLAY